ncbi:4Fe-4S dicluster domain-containing protein [Chloroflexota bacterium]
MKRITWDQQKCTGCRVCEAICSFVKEGEFNPIKARGKVLHTVDRQIRYTIRVYCLQCEEAYCMAICPASAISVKDGIKIVDENKCLGCKMCEIACPVGAIAVNPEKGVALKCDLCVDQEEPQCVKYCYSEALQYLPSETVGYALARTKSQKFLDIVKKEA